MSLYLMKNADCFWEKDFVRINGSIKHWNNRNLSLVLETNVSTMVDALLAGAVFPVLFWEPKKVL